MTLHVPVSTDPLWYKDAIIYELHVRAFFDSNDDGVGDFPGLIQKLDYIQDLGVNTIWLLPFYPSPLRDDGYDISDYRGVNPAYGTMDDFKRFLHEAHARGLRVFTELVVNHTSDQHPWFQAARRAPAGSPKRNYYVWSETGREYADTRVIFTDTESSNWTWDPVAKAFYWHRFFSHQPDLNFDNPHVLKAVLKVMDFWFRMGVDGMRLDAVPYLIEREGTNCENLPETHAILKQMRRWLDERYPGRALLAEANQWPADVRPYFGEGDECHMAYHFPLMPRIFMAVRQEDALPIVEIMRQTPDIPANAQWALFLRNHDELTLEMVTDEERDYMYSAYAADPQMRLNVGIRRRLAPLLDYNRALIELVNSLLLSMPGSPIIYYGDEIGMGDNVFLGDRNGVRTPMQWTGDRNAGFSRANPARLYAPPIMDPLYGYQAINVEAQERSPASLLNWMRRMLALRRQYPTFGRGSFEPLATSNRRVLAYLREDAQQQIVVVSNMARTAQPVHIDLSRFKGMHLVEIIGNTEMPVIGDEPYFLTLAPHGFFWFQLSRVAKPVVLQRPRLAGRDEPVPTLLVSAVWNTLLDGHARVLLERDALAPFLTRQRWYGAKSRTMRRARFVDWTLIDPKPAVFLSLIEVEFEEGPPERYLVVLATAAGDAAREVMEKYHGAVVARLSGARAGVLYDGMVDPAVAGRVFDLMKRGGTFALRSGAIRVQHVSPGAEMFESDPVPMRVQVRSLEQSNSTVFIGDRYVLKVFRQLQPGENPDVEVGRRLAGHSQDARVPALVAFAMYEPAGAPPVSVAMLQQQVPSRGSAWELALDSVEAYCERALIEQRQRTERGDTSPPTPEEIRELIGAYCATAELLGRRTADLHHTLAGLEGEGFGARPLDTAGLAAMAQDISGQVERALELLRNAEGSLSEQTRHAAARLVELKPAIVARLERLRELPDGGMRTRIHGDFHLGQVLEADGDVYFIDFEGEPARPVSERIVPQSPLRDVAGLLRSYGYAARAGLREFERQHPEARLSLEPWIRGWEAEVSARYLRSYFQRIEEGPSIVPASEARQVLLEAFLIEKGVYELGYELGNRPDWIDIPLRALLQLLDPEWVGHEDHRGGLQGTPA
jgi:maltose alpha-D-glucosyltransferase/alpha-amylase